MYFIFCLVVDESGLVTVIHQSTIVLCRVYSKPSPVPTRIPLYLGYRPSPCRLEW